MSCVNTDRRQPSLARVAVAARRRRARGTAHFFEPALSAALEQARGDPAACEPPVLVVVRRVKSSLQIWPLNLFYELVVSEVGKGSFAPKMTSSQRPRVPQPSAPSAMAGLAQKIPLPVVALGGVGVGVFALLKLMRLVGGGDFADSQARYRRCNRCAKKGAKVRCTRCRRAYYCSRACLKAAWKLEICECC